MDLSTIKISQKLRAKTFELPIDTLLAVATVAGAEATISVLRRRS